MYKNYFPWLSIPHDPFVLIFVPFATWSSFSWVELLFLKCFGLLVFLLTSGLLVEMDYFKDEILMCSHLF